MAIYELDGEAPQLPEGGRYYIADTAVVIGRVRLHADASIWFGSVLRGDLARITLGPRVNLQDGCIVHTDHDEPLTIEEGVVVGHRAVLHGRRIGRDSLIGRELGVGGDDLDGGWRHAKLIGRDLAQRGLEALAKLGLAGEHRDVAVGIDPDPGVEHRLLGEIARQPGRFLGGHRQLAAAGFGASRPDPADSPPLMDPAS